MNFESTITDIRTLLGTCDPQNGTHDEATVTLKLLGKPYTFTEWYSLETLELETTDDQRSTGNSEGYDALFNAIEGLESENDDCCSTELLTGIDKAVNCLISIEVNTSRFEASLKEAGINQTEFCNLVDITRQSVAHWKRTGAFPAWVHFALLGIQAQRDNLPPT